MKIFGSILAVLYAGLMLFAVYMEKAHFRKEALSKEEEHSQEEKRSQEEAHPREDTKSASSAFIAAGCLLDLGYTVCNLFWDRNLIVILIIGMICISAGALMNGFRQKKVHVPHHIIRLILEIIITTICWIGG